MYKIIRPLLFLFDPEYIHEKTVNLCYRLSKYPRIMNKIKKMYDYEAPELKNEIFGMRFKNPVGLAAGFDKNAKLVDFMPALGFGYTTVGSVTSYKFNGRRKPRVFRLRKDGAILNRMGLNNIGADAVYEIMKNAKIEVPIKISIAKSNRNCIVEHKATQDYLYTFVGLYDQGQVFELNPWCPNSKEGKTTYEALDEILRMIELYQEEKNKRKPIVVKLSPDVTDAELDKTIEICQNNYVDGYVICNTTKNRGGLVIAKKKIEQMGEGGISGKPLAKRAEELTRKVYKMTKGKKVIIGVGGVTVENAYDRILAGASLLEVFTGLVYEGPGIVKKIKMELVRRMQEDGVKNISDIIGAKASK